MALILVCHGAWSGGWSWKKLRAPLAEMGHDLLTPTYTGLGERSHLNNPMIDLETHVRDILAVIEYEDLREIVLVGHSYGGMIATGVADRSPDRITQVVYLDAFVPEDGQSVFDLRGAAAEEMRRLATTRGDHWFIPPTPLAPDVTQEDIDWVTPRRGRQPLKTFEQKLKLAGNVDRLPRSYIWCRRKDDSDPFRPIAARIKALPGWRYYEIDSGHTPNITRPGDLAVLLGRIVAEP